MTGPLLDIRDLSVAFDGEDGPREALRRVSLSIAPREILGVVGESGSGKSVTALAIMRLRRGGSPAARSNSPGPAI